MLGVYVICLRVQGHQHWFRYSLVGQELWIAFTSLALSHWTGIITVELQLILFAH